MIPPVLLPFETTFAPDICYACSGSGCDPEGYGCTMCNGLGSICDIDLVDAMSEDELDAFLDSVASGNGWPPS